MKPTSKLLNAAHKLGKKTAASKKKPKVRAMVPIATWPVNPEQTIPHLSFLLLK